MRGVDAQPSSAIFVVKVLNETLPYEIYVMYLLQCRLVSNW